MIVTDDMLKLMISLTDLGRLDYNRYDYRYDKMVALRDLSLVKYNHYGMSWTLTSDGQRYLKHNYAELVLA